MIIHIFDYVQFKHFVKIKYANLFFESCYVYVLYWTNYYFI